MCIASFLDEERFKDAFFFYDCFLMSCLMWSSKKASSYSKKVSGGQVPPAQPEPACAREVLRPWLPEWGTSGGLPAKPSQPVVDPGGISGVLKCFWYGE